MTVCAFLLPSASGSAVALGVVVKECEVYSLLNEGEMREDLNNV
jgi:hypothetical protein